MGPLSSDARRYMRWAAVLDAIEQNLVEVESMVDRAGVSDESLAEVPEAALATFEELGPLPLTLAERAAALAERQYEILARGQDKLLTMRRQIRLSQDLRVDAGPTPIYLDTTG